MDTLTFQDQSELSFWERTFELVLEGNNNVARATEAADAAVHARRARGWGDDEDPPARDIADAFAKLTD